MMQGHNWKWRRWEQWQLLGRWRLSSRTKQVRHANKTHAQDVLCLPPASTSAFFVANHALVLSERERHQLSVSHVWSLRGHVQCCRDTRSWADIPGPSPMDQGLQMPSQDSWSTTGLVVLGTPCQLNVSWLLTGWSLTQQEKEMEE